MKLSDHPQLKREILDLPVKERDKLLLRLVAKDKILTERMHFLLLEGEMGVEIRLQDLKSTLAELLDSATDYEKSESGALLKLVRQGMKEINHFYKVTKHKNEHIELKLYFLNLLNLANLKSNFLRSAVKQELLYKYLIKTTLSIYKSVHTLHEDLQYDLADAGSNWLASLTKYAPKGLANDLGLINTWE